MKRKRYKKFFENRELIWNFLFKYKNNSNIYITFTQIEQVKINKKTLYVNDTPMGLYCYPLKEFIKKYIKNLKSVDLKKKTIGDFAPLAGKAKFISFIEKITSNFIEDLYKDYTKQDYNKDLKKLKKLHSFSDEEWKEIIEHAKIMSSISSHPASTFLWLTKSIAYKYSKKIFKIWTDILLSLGYDGMADKSGQGFIYPTEPIQAVFFKESSFKVLKTFEND